jgi:hypothetical protein
LQENIGDFPEVDFHYLQWFSGICQFFREDFRPAIIARQANRAGAESAIGDALFLQVLGRMARNRVCSRFKAPAATFGMRDMGRLS